MSRKRPVAHCCHRLVEQQKATYNDTTEKYSPCGDCAAIYKFAACRSQGGDWIHAL